MVAIKDNISLKDAVLTVHERDEGKKRDLQFLHILQTGIKWHYSKGKRVAKGMGKIFSNHRSDRELTSRIKGMSTIKQENRRLVP